jgi:copper chaperone CopZ
MVYKFKVKGIDCIACAFKLEKLIKSIDADFVNVKVNIIALTVTIDSWLDLDKVIGVLDECSKQFYYPIVFELEK